jgi:hypothetical protein
VVGALLAGVWSLFPPLPAAPPDTSAGTVRVPSGPPEAVSRCGMTKTA